MHAAYYHRMSEFFCLTSAPKKTPAMRIFRGAFIRPWGRTPLKGGGALWRRHPAGPKSKGPREKGVVVCAWGIRLLYGGVLSVPWASD